MSHFTVIVFGDDPDQQLAKYDENLEGCENAKWDWYSLGGRWLGYFKAKNFDNIELGKPGVFDNAPEVGYVDALQKGNIDIEAMRQDKIKEYKDYYNKVCRIINNWRWKNKTSFDELPSPISWKKFKSFVNDKSMTPDEARATYYKQEFTSDFSNNDLYFFDEDPIEDIWAKTEDQYVEEKMVDFMVPYAFVINGEWIERGEMGWWGITLKDNDYTEYCNKFWETFNSLPDDTMVYLFDCHI